MASNDNKNKSSTTAPIKNGSPVGPTADNTEQAKTPAPAMDTNTQTTTEGDSSKKSKLEQMREKNKKSSMDAAKILEMFDSTKANEVETKGTSSRGVIKPQSQGMLIAGRNVGAEESEPDWTNEQLDFIRQRTNTNLEIQSVSDSRRSVMDREMKFVGRDENGSVTATEAAYVTALDPATYCIGIGPPKYDITGSPKHYMDAVIADRAGNWLVNQWTSEWVVIEGVAPDVLMKQHRNGASLQSNRRIGINFARIGLPKIGFGPLFGTLSANYPGIMSNVIETQGYYWMNASWGVASFSATFAYMRDGRLERTSNLADVMRMLGGKSSLSLATVAISITCGSKNEGDKPVPDKSSFGLSVKLHNAFGVSIVDFHGPPQQGSTGMMIPNRIVAGAQSMGGGSTAGGGLSIFSNTKSGLFGTVSQPPASVRSEDSTTYMP